MASKFLSSFRLHYKWMDVLMIISILAVPLVSSSHNQFIDGDIRLTGNGSSKLAGRLEIYHNGTWGTVCARSQLFNFNPRAATVACRQLGLGWAVEYYSPHFLPLERHRFGTPINVALLDNVRCEGHEPHLLRCSTGVLGSPSSECDADSAVSVTCSNMTAPYNGQVALSHDSSGVLQLYSNRSWGAVCSTSFTMTTAHAVCRQLGYTEAMLFREARSYSGPIWNIESAPDCGDNLECFSNCLSQLPTVLLQSVSSCTPVEVSCSLSLADLSTHPSGNTRSCQRPPQTPQDGDVYLNSSSQTTDITSQGRLELYFDGSWGTVCDTSFLYKEADVVCKSLGFPSALTYGGGIYSGNDGSGDVFNLTCSGLEETVHDCAIHRTDSCSHDHDVEVTCSPILPPYGALAIRSGRRAEGALYIFTGESMMPICDHNFGITEATVACRQLGYPGAVSVRPNGYYRGRTFSDVEERLYTVSSCQGDEDYLLSCPFTTESSSHCRPGLDEVAVVCVSTTTTDNSQKDVRLVGGPTSNSGRLEVRLNGEWESVCSGRQENRSEFSRLEAHVVCQELQNGNTVRDIQFISYSAVGPNAPLKEVSCSGFEESILDCQLEEETNSRAERCTEVVSLECMLHDVNSEFQVRLIDHNNTGNTTTTTISSSMEQGQVQITYRGLNMSMCGLLFTERDAQVICRQLGFARMVEFCTNSCFGSGDGFIFLAETSCGGSEETLGECGVQVHHSDMCDHSSDVGIACEGTLATTSSPSDTPSPTMIATGFDSIYIYIIAGSSVGGLVLAALIVFIICGICCCVVRHKRKRNQGTWRSPNSTLTTNSRAGNSQHTDHPKLNNYIRNDLSASDEASSKSTKQAAEARNRVNDFDDPTEALEMKQMPSNSAHNMKKTDLFEDNATTEHPSSLTIDSGYGVSSSNITFGPESPPPNYDELDLLPVATASASASSSAAKRQNETEFKNLSFKESDISDGEKKHEDH